MAEFAPQTITKPGTEAPQAGAVQGTTNGVPIPVSAATTTVAILNRFGVSTGTGVTVSAAGTTTVYTPTAGAHVRLRWIGLSSPSTNTATMLVTVSLGGTVMYLWDMGAPGAFAHGTRREGPVDGMLQVTLSDSQTVRVNFDVEEF